MSGQYGDMQDFAVEMCEEFGGTVTFNRYSPTVYAETNEVVFGNPVLVFSAPAVILPVNDSHGPAFDNRLLNGTLAGKKLRYLLVAARDATFEPASMDRVTIASEAWQVVGCTPLSPAGDAVTYGVGVYKL